MILEKLHNYYLQAHIDNPWENAKFKDIYYMTNDGRGEFGEKLISEIFHECGYTIDEDVSNVNIHPDGHYDIKVNGKRIEVKTSCLSSSLMWQHEPLYKKNVCDGVIFIDFAYDVFYITMVKNDELPLDKSVEKLFGRKHGTLRKNKDDGYKLDFSYTTINTLIKEQRCEKFDSNVSMNDLKHFMEGHFNDVL